MILPAGMQSPETPAEALEAEAARALPLTAVYDTPANLVRSSPDYLLRRERVSEYTLPDGIKAQRILYRSLSAEGKAVVTSTEALVPAGRTSRDGFVLSMVNRERLRCRPIRW